jgi:hypothetical protein
MAVVFDAQSSGSVNPATTLTVAHTCTGSNRVLLVGLSTNNTTDIVTGVTYNGVSMTKLKTQVGSSGNFYSYLFYLQNPASGTNNIVATASSSSLMGAINASFTGADQVASPDSSASGTATGAGTTVSATTTVIAADSMLFGHVRASSGLTAGTGTTSNGTLFGGAFISGYSTSTVGSGSQTLAFTRVAADIALWLVASIAPVAATSQIKSWSGVANS